ncbi:MAG TPA: DUF1559 domain-containing protein [Gemmataceae bacterium]|nr:DUF1559 domain-containing protein [Gemmataceae bacterium]
MTRSNTARREGFSRTELTVVIALGFLGLGLLVPAIYAARQQPAARTITINNLRQIVIACHNHHDTYKKFPPAYDKWPGFKTNATVHVYILPFIEEGKLYNLYRTEGGGGERDKAVVEPFLSPMDKTNPKPAAGIQNFAANLRVFGDSKVKENAAVTLADTMNANARMPGHFTSGTSNCVFFATKYGVCGKGGSRYASPPKSDTAAFFGQNVAKVAAAPADPTATFQTMPNDTQCVCSPALPQSYEATGLFVAMGDASTRSVSPRVSPQVWNLVITPSHAQPIAADWNNPK